MIPSPHKSPSAAPPPTTPITVSARYRKQRGRAASIFTLLTLAYSTAHGIQLGQLEHQGMQLRININPVTLAHTTPQAPSPTAHQRVRVSIAVSDTTTNKAFTSAYPAAWIHPLTQSATTDSQNNRPKASCNDKVQSFISGGLFSQAQLDLNSYHVITLNHDASLTVIDPKFGFGNGRILRHIPLSATGFDWTRSKNYQAVYVSTPTARQVLRFDTASWQAKHNTVPAEYGAPRYLALQPDERYLWVTLRDSVAVLDSLSLKPIQLIPTGKQPVAIQFSPDSQTAFVANYAANTVSIIDVASLKKIKDITTGSQPVSMDYSTLAEALYVSHRGDGSIAVIDGHEHMITATAQSEPGLGMLRFAPNQRWALIVNPRTNRLSILDAANNQIVNTGLVDKAPEQIAFSNELAYIRHRDSNQLLMLTLADSAIGKPGMPIPVVDTPGGDKPPGRMRRATPASGITKVPGANAVVLSNPGDQAIYFYKEGMAAPMGQFVTPGNSPRAVMALDMSLKERRKPGLYETVVDLPAAGQYELIVYMDSPRVAHCLPLTIKADAQHTQSTTKRARWQLLNSKAIYEVNQPQTIEFVQVNTAPQETPTATQPSVIAHISHVSGVWSSTIPLKTAPISGQANDKPLAVQRGILDFTPPLAGSYRIYIEESLNTPGNSSAPIKQHLPLYLRVKGS